MSNDRMIESYKLVIRNHSLNQDISDFGYILAVVADIDDDKANQSSIPHSSNKVLTKLSILESRKLTRGRPPRKMISFDFSRTVEGLGHMTSIEQLQCVHSEFRVTLLDTLQG